MIARRTLIAGALGVPLLLSGCQTIPENAIRWQGRFAVTISASSKTVSETGRFELIESNGRRRLDLLTPLSGVIARIETDDKGATLWYGSRSDPFEAPNLDALLLQHLGFTVPIALLLEVLSDKSGRLSTGVAGGWRYDVTSRQPSGEAQRLVLEHALTAASLGIPTSNILIAENGSNVILSQDEIKLGEPVTAGAVMVDGLGVGDVGNVVLRDRKHLSEDGLVIIVATVDSKTGKVLAGPDLVSRGFVYVRENESLMDGAQSIVENALDRCVEEHVRDWNSVKTRVREALSSYIYRRTKRSPMILPILMEV